MWRLTSPTRRGKPSPMPPLVSDASLLQKSYNRTVQDQIQTSVLSRHPITMPSTPAFRCGRHRGRHRHQHHEPHPHMPNIRRKASPRTNPSHTSSLTCDPRLDLDIGVAQVPRHSRREGGPVGATCRQTFWPTPTLHVRGVPGCACTFVSKHF